MQSRPSVSRDSRFGQSLFAFAAELVEPSECLNAINGVRARFIVDLVHVDVPQCANDFSIALFYYYSLGNTQLPVISPIVMNYESLRCIEAPAARSTVCYP